MRPGAPMIEPSTKRAPLEATTFSIAATVSTLTALQSMYTAFFELRCSGLWKRCAIAIASLGGTIERMKSAAAMASSSASINPARVARSAVAALRPVSEVSTRAP